MGKEMKKTRRAIALAILICMLAALLSGCGSVSNDIISALREGDVREANNLYLQKVRGNDKELEKFNTAYSEELNKVFNDYNADKIDGQEAMRLYNNFCDFKAADDFSELTEKIFALNNSRSMYRLGEQYLESNDYLSAMAGFYNVNVIDSYYETARQRLEETYNTYINKLLTEAEAYAAQDNYEAAAELLGNAKEQLESCVIHSYGGELDARYEEYSAAKSASAVAADISAADKLMQSGEYIKALEKLYAALEDWPEEPTLLRAIDNCSRSYANSVLDDAANRFTVNQDYAGAAAIIEVAEDEIRDENISALLKRACEYYQAYVPVWIGDLETFYDDGDPKTATWNIKDNLDQTYSMAYYHDRDQNDTYAVYKVSQFDHFDCRIIVSSYDKNYDNLGTVELYLDGNLAYQSPTMGMGVEPIDVSLDLNGAVELKICSSGRRHAGYFGSLYPYLVNAYIFKSPEGASAFTERA